MASPSVRCGTRLFAPALTLALAAGLAALGITPLGPAGVANAQAQQQLPPELRIDVSGWQGGIAVNPQSGQVSDCRVSKPYGPGLALLFALNPRSQLNVVIANEGAGYEPGAEASARIRIDQSFDQTFPAQATQPGVMVIGTGQNQRLIDRIMRGNVMTVSVAGDSFDFSLSGTFAAFTALEQCLNRTLQLARAQAPAGTGAGAGAGPAAQPTGSGLTPQTMAVLLQQAGLDPSEFQLADPSSMPEDPLDLAVAWRVPLRVQGRDQTVGLVGAAHQQPRTDDGVALPTFMDRYIGGFRSRCEGTLTEDRGAVEQIGERYGIARSELLCTTPDAEAYVTLLFVLDNTHYTAFFHEASPPLLEPARQLTDNLEQVVRAIAARAIEAEAAADGDGDG